MPRSKENAVQDVHNRALYQRSWNKFYKFLKALSGKLLASILQQVTSTTLTSKVLRTPLSPSPMTTILLCTMVADFSGGFPSQSNIWQCIYLWIILLLAIICIWIIYFQSSFHEYIKIHHILTVQWFLYAHTFVYVLCICNLCLCSESSQIYSSTRQKPFHQ